MPRSVKWILIILAIPSLLLAVFIAHGKLVTDPNVIEEIRANPTGERAGIVMLLSLPDGRQIPVNYLREENQVFVGADGPWWRTFRHPGAPVSLEIRGEILTGRATVILDDPVYVNDIFSRLRPTVPNWLPDWLNGKLVAITLDHTDT